MEGCIRIQGHRDASKTDAHSLSSKHDLTAPQHGHDQTTPIACNDKDMISHTNLF